MVGDRAAMFGKLAGHSARWARLAQQRPLSISVSKYTTKAKAYAVGKTELRLNEPNVGLPSVQSPRVGDSAIISGILMLKTRCCASFHIFVMTIHIVVIDTAQSRAQDPERLSIEHIP